DRLGLMRLRRTDAQYADGRVEAVDLAEVMTIEMLGRQIEITPMVLGEHVLLGVMVLEGLDLLGDCHSNRLVHSQGTWDPPVFRVSRESLHTVRGAYVRSADGSCWMPEACMG